MNRITQEAKKRQGVVKLANRKGKSFCEQGTWGELVKREAGGANDMTGAGSHWQNGHIGR